MIVYVNMEMGSSRLTASRRRARPGAGASSQAHASGLRLNVPRNIDLSVSNGGRT